VTADDERELKPAWLSGAGVSGNDPVRLPVYYQWEFNTGFEGDFGGTCSQALGKYISTRNPFSGSADPRTAGNGSLMRLVPVVLAYRPDPAQAVSPPKAPAQPTARLPQSMPASSMRR
jgi:ADP-ribosyl-[dinitrogen reductase] hydrolase